MGSVNCILLVGLKLFSCVKSGYLECEYWLNIIFGMHFFLFGTQRQRWKGGWCLFHSFSSFYALTTRNITYHYYCLSLLALRWLDTVFQGQYLPSLSINYVAINKDLEKLPPTQDENLLRSMLQWHQSCHSNKITLLPILLAAVFLGTGNCSSKIAYGSFFLQ